MTNRSFIIPSRAKKQGDKSVDITDDSILNKSKNVADSFLRNMREQKLDSEDI